MAWALRAQADWVDTGSRLRTGARSAPATSPAQERTPRSCLAPGLATTPLGRQYPRLCGRLPHVPLGCFPTPVERLDRVADELGIGRLYIKRDDLSGAAYGGNKVRKLEFLLGAALRAGAREVITIGFAGSNHALATAIYARVLGLKSTALLMPQANAHYVRRNLLAGRHYGSELRPCRGALAATFELMRQLVRGRSHSGAWPCYIPPGGSSPLGVTGYVNAALELRDQVIAGELPEPDCLYVTLGSTGTTVGLALGLKVAGLRTRLVPVRVIEPAWAGARGVARLYDASAAYLHGLDPAFPAVRAREAGLTIRNDCLGEGYARFTAQGVRSAELLHRAAGIPLNGAYSAKAFSALLADAERGALKGKTVLFWNTYNSRDLTAATAGVDYRELPVAFHRYFEEEVQPLDRDGLDR